MQDLKPIIPTARKSVGILGTSSSGELAKEHMVNRALMATSPVSNSSTGSIPLGTSATTTNTDKPQQPHASSLTPSPTTNMDTTQNSSKLSLENSEAIVYDSSEEEEEKVDILEESDSDHVDQLASSEEETAIRRRRTRSSTRADSNLSSSNTTKKNNDKDANQRQNQLASLRFTEKFKQGSEDEEGHPAVVFDSDDDEEEDTHRKFAENVSKAIPKQKAEPSRKKQKMTSITQLETTTNETATSKIEAKQSNVLSIEPHSVLFKFICSTTTNVELRNKLKQDFEDEKYVILRKKYNLKTPSRKGRISDNEVKLIKKYVEITSSLRLVRHPLSLTLFNNTKSFDEDRIKTWSNDSQEEEVNTTNVKHFIATITGRSFDLISSVWRKEEKNIHHRFVLYLEQMRYHFEVFVQPNTVHMDREQEEELKEMYISLLGLMKQYQDIVNTRREERKNGMLRETSIELSKFAKILSNLDEHFSRLDAYQRAYNEELHDALWSCAVKYLLA
ncbi:hypothetical protein C9374_011194 [Naegleria lovaniensis]|uniref:Uncharacterized protein n=1 Tax=Naegleria lovaniensis TaxID=51637 RepID=A0AA88G9Y5_NAELO|nr:uncharacterized protein C9374_011194 [Naegleria lovaniensis]KAG2374115.1 hypothetical protein C9374_011194 [Naegleria lovaniensis]